MCTFFTFPFGKRMWVRGGRLWLSKTIFKPNIKIAKVQDSLLKANERNFENILFFDPKYV